MSRRKVGVNAFLIGLPVLALLIAGCQFSYKYEVRGIIKDFSGRAPLRGVRVSLDANGLTDSGPVYLTGSDGVFYLNFEVRDVEFMNKQLPKWYIELKKAGYETERIDISPDEAPKMRTFIIVNTLMVKEPHWQFNRTAAGKMRVSGPTEKTRCSAPTPPEPGRVESH